MVIHRCLSICVLLLTLAAGPAIAFAQEGFILNNRSSRATSPTGRFYKGSTPYTARPRLLELAARPFVKKTQTATPKYEIAAAKPAKSSAMEHVAAERSTDDSGVSSTTDYPESICDTDAYCCDTGCCDTGCCDAASCGCGCDCYGCCNKHDFFRSGQFYMRGWIDQGLTFNSASPANRSNGPVGYNWRSNDYMMNQLYAIMGRDVCANGCFWDAGGRVDLLYGTDYRYLQAVGLETHSNGSPRWNAPTSAGNEALYGLSMPQLYAEFAVPFARGTTLKFGHFYSIIGYESPMAPQNFFYSHSYTKVYGEPETETGMLASTKITPQFVFHGGFSRGWDMWESPYNTVTFIGGACWTSRDDRTSVGFAIDTGDLEEDKNRTILSLVVTRQLARRWTYVFQYDFGSQQDAFRNQQGQLQRANWYGIDNYLFYALSDTLSAGLRVEWFCDEDRYIVFDAAGNPALSGNDYCEITLGLNWQPNDSIIVRPELRWDGSDVKGSRLFPFRPYNDFTSSHQFLFATDIIIRF